MRSWLIANEARRAKYWSNTPSPPPLPTPGSRPLKNYYDADFFYQGWMFKWPTSSAGNRLFISEMLYVIHMICLTLKPFGSIYFDKYFPNKISKELLLVLGLTQKSSVKLFHSFQRLRSPVRLCLKTTSLKQPWKYKCPKDNYRIGKREGWSKHKSFGGRPEQNEVLGL